MAAIRIPGRSHSFAAGLPDQLGEARSRAMRFARGLVSARTLAHATWAVALVGSAIVALLALRVWLQLTGDTGAGGLTGLGYGLTGVLVAPFRSFEPQTTIKDSGILEFSSLVAMEAYLIATMLALAVLFTLRLAAFAAPKVVHRSHRTHSAAGESGRLPAPERTAG